LESWIESFVQSTSALESPECFRLWAAITTISAAVEQKVYLQTTSILYPNIYCFLVAHPGVGKTRTVRAARQYYLETPEPHVAPTSMTGSAMVDTLLASKRTFIRLPEGPLEYNSMYITADELGAFMHKYDDEAIAIMSAFYDSDEYGQRRRGNDLKLKIKSPQLNVLCGTTPSNLLKYLPESAWEQGFTSRVVMVFSDERTIGDDFADHKSDLNPDLIHDLRGIAGLMGKFEVTAEYRDCVNLWRTQGEPPLPTHPKLIHYATRRRVHLYKLSMVSAIDRSDTLLLTRDDFNRALNWLAQAEYAMPEIFKAGAGNADAKAMEEIFHYVLTQCVGGRMCPERKIVSFAKERVPIHSVMRVIDIMIAAGQLIPQGAADYRTGQRNFKPGVPEIGEHDL
jgi:hypothetical protein